MAADPSPFVPLPYVFLSYASPDAVRASRILEQLEAAGVRVWFDRAAISGGATWSGEIVTGIQGCSALVVLCSPAAMASANVQRELQLAMEEGRPLLPLLLEPFVQTPDVRYILAGRQSIELLDRPDAKWMPQVMAALERIGVATASAAAPQEQPGVIRQSNATAPKPPPRRSLLPRRGVIVGATVAVAVLALVLLGTQVLRRAGGVKAGTVANAATLGQPPSALLPLAPKLSVYAGNGQAGHLNGPAGLAQFAGPWNVAVDRSSNLLVSDLVNNRIRQVAITGLVSDFAGSGLVGDADGSNSSASFSFIASSASGLTMGPDGTLYVADSGNYRIRSVSPAGTVSTLAGSGQQGLADGAGTASQFGSFGGIVADSTGTLYATDPLNNRIRKISPQGVVTTLAGSATHGFADGPADRAQFDMPGAVTVNKAGDVFVVDRGNNRIRKVTADGIVSTFAGSGEKGSADGPPQTAQFNAPWAMTADASDNLYVLEPANRRIRKITPEGAVSTFFQITNPDQHLSRIAVDKAGNLYLPDVDHNFIYKLTVGISR